jgi:endonuclease/exonuclease/phosphatase family metal-dependent hydrolase
MSKTSSNMSSRRVQVRRTSMLLRWIALGGVMLVCGCATFPPDQVAKCLAREPAIQIDPGTGQATTDLSVLTYNVEGLPWPARRNRSARLQKIGRQLAAMRQSGRSPDVVLLQEVFTTQAARIGVDSGYKTRVRGPGRRAQRPPTSEAADISLTGRRKLFKGERLGRLFSSGLYVLSDMPISLVAGQPFRRRECAGFDCLANKGLQHVRLQVPGVPQPIEIFNTHLNAGGASRVSPERSLLAHNLQVEETGRFILQQRDPELPMILGGDFNMRGDDNRFARFTETVPYTLVHRHCSDPAAGCDVLLSWDGDAPWMDTQDLQSFQDGTVVTVRPMRVEGMFDEPWLGAPLADHDGLLVTYRLTWPAAAAQVNGTSAGCWG